MVTTALDLFGPLEVFAAAKEVAGCCYHWSVASFSKAPVRSESGTQIVPDFIIGDTVDVDTLILVGGAGARTLTMARAELSALSALADNAQRVVSICTGAFLLESLGLAEGRHLATHWRYADQLAEQAPGAKVNPDALYIHDDKVWSSAGVTAGIDLSLALVADDYGNAVSTAVAQQLVVYMRRTGDQAQFSAPLVAQSQDAGRLTPVLDWMVNNLSRVIHIDDLAARACLGPRQFSRVFQKALGKSPARYLEQLRYGNAVSTAVAQQLVVYMRRTGDQAQFSAPLVAQSQDAGRLTPVLDWMVNNLSRVIHIDDLAARACLGPRQFSRVFQKALGKSPARYLEQLRMDRARLMLSNEKVRISEVATETGFTNPDSFRRAFERRFSVTPTLYQKQFSTRKGNPK